jgi:hypothetical protein
MPPLLLPPLRLLLPLPQRIAKAMRCSSAISNGITRPFPNGSGHRTSSSASEQTTSTLSEQNPKCMYALRLVLRRHSA